MTLFLCPVCPTFSTRLFNVFCQHCLKRHKNDSKFVIYCCVENCPYATKNLKAYKLHVQRKHTQNETRDEPKVSEDCDDNQSSIGVVTGAATMDMSYTGMDSIHFCNDNETAPSDSITLAGKFALGLEIEHKLSQKATDVVIHSTKEYAESILNDFKSRLQNMIHEQGYHDDILDEVPMAVDQYFDSIATQRKRDNCYLSNMGLVAPQAVVLRQEHRTNGIKRHLGYFVPFKDNLQAFLSQPEVLHYVHHPHNQRGNIMHDLCDGDFIKTHTLFMEHPQALQIVINSDDIEIVNPIGSHTKKHKLSMFYFTLANIPPEMRSNLSAIQLVAVAKSNDLRMNNSKALGILLGDFIETVKQLSGNGIQLCLNGCTEKLYGALVLAPCDSLAATWLGGYKESATFAYKGCRTCKANAEEMKSVFRDTVVHR